MYDPARDLFRSDEASQQLDDGADDGSIDISVKPKDLTATTNKVHSLIDDQPATEVSVISALCLLTVLHLNYLSDVISLRQWILIWPRSVKAS